MTRLYVGMQHDALMIYDDAGGTWEAEARLQGQPVQCVAVDSRRPTRVYCGTFGQGLFASDDAGTTWRPVGEGIAHKEIMAVSVSPSERVGDDGVVYVGTEPSALYRSESGGATWIERTALQDLPSKPRWSYPPRPWTHHVRWIQPDPYLPNILFVAIEQGGVMRSLDKGLTFEDRKPGAQVDCHSMAMHKRTAGRVYEAAGGERPVFEQGPRGEYVVMTGGGYAQSYNAGSTWQAEADGLVEHYGWHVAVDPGDPDTVLMSVARGPAQAHQPPLAESFLYRRSGGGPWRKLEQTADDGLFMPQGTLISELTSLDAQPGVFYCANNRGVFHSADAGQTWEKLDLPWPERYAMKHVRGFQVVG
jgi:hypothetical protein